MDLQPTEDYDEFNCRISLFGAENVGKTKLVNRLMHNKYTETYIPTVEDYYRSISEYAGVTLSLEVIDTGGTEQFPAMRKLNMQQSNLIVLVYDTKNEASLPEVKRLYGIKKEITNTITVIAGTKADFLPNDTPRKYEHCIDDATAFVNSQNDKQLHHCLCSSRTGEGVDKIIEHGLTTIKMLKLAASTFWDGFLNQFEMGCGGKRAHRHGMGCFVKGVSFDKQT